MTIPPPPGSGEPPTAPSVPPQPVPPAVGPAPDLGVGHAGGPPARPSWAALVSGPPALVVAAAVLVAGAVVVLQSLVVLIAASGSGTGLGGGLLDRLRSASAVLSLPLLLVVPLALLLVVVVGDRRRDGGDTGPGVLEGVPRATVVAAATLAGAFGCIVVLGFVANLSVGGVDAATRIAVLLGDVARLVVAAAGTWWAVSLLRQGADRNGAHRVAPLGTDVPGRAGSAPPLGQEPPPGGSDWRPADPGWGAQPPVWPQRPPTEGPPDRP
jgi:hypothetical protein